MTLVQALLLGIVQGLTEFLPVSSSGHLVIVRSLMGIQPAGMTFEVMVHFATLLAILVAFRGELVELVRAVARLPAWMLRREASNGADDPYLRLALLILLGSVPAGVAGLLWKDAIGQLFQNPSVAAAMLLVTGLLLWVSDRVHWGSSELLQLRPWQALVTGVAQAAALVPGISRSGSTITVALFAGVRRDAAGRFSFLLAIPAIAGATLLEARELLAGAGSVSGPALLAGAVAAGVSGYAAIHLLMGFVRSGRLRFFAYYTWLVGLVVLWLTR